MSQPGDSPEWFYTVRDSPAAVIRAASIVSEGNRSVYGAVVALDVPEEQLRARLDSGRASLYGLSGLWGPVSLVQAERPVGTHQDLSRVMRVLVWKDPDAPLLFVLACQKRADFDFVLARLITFLSACISLIYCRTQQFRDILSNVEADTAARRVQVREYVSRSLIDDAAMHKRVETQRRWTEETVQHLFSRLAAERQWLTSAQFAMTSSYGPCIARLLRDGSFTCDTGFAAFERLFLPQLRATAIRTRGFFDNRGRRNSPDGQVRPMCIRYNHPVFESKRANHRLLSVLSSFASSALSIVHPNPYLQAGLIDYTDGSNYSVWVARHDEILIIPGTKATGDSLQRLCNHICDEFEEGIVHDFEPDPSAD